MKKIFILILILTFSCNKKDKLITNSQIDNFKIGENLSNDFDKNDFEITLDSDNKINSIIVTSENYKTKDNFGVGSDLNDIEKHYGIERNIMNLNKGDVVIGTIGTRITYDNITFIDGNKDNLVDLVMINKQI